MNNFFNINKFNEYFTQLFLLILGIVIIFAAFYKFINFFTMFLFYLIFSIFFLICPMIFKKGFGSLFKNVIKEILLFQLYFLKETYVSKYTCSRKSFYYSSMFLGLICFKIFDNIGILLALFFLLYLNMVFIIFGSNEDSFIWNFFVKNVGYEKCVNIVGNLLSAITTIVAKSLLKISKPMVKSAGVFIAADAIAVKTGFYDYAAESLHDLAYIQKQSMGIETQYKSYSKPPAKSIIGSIMGKL